MGKLIINFFKAFGLFFSKKRQSKISRALARISFTFYRSIENHNYEKTNNGEFSFLTNLQSLDTEIKTIFDVGANKGEWAQDTLKYFPNANIYCFEPIEKTYSILEQQLKNHQNINLFNFGLSDISETLTFYTSDSSDELSSSIKIVAEQTHNEIKAVVKNGYEFTMENKINEIDFLKIDVEGMEHKVLSGLLPIIKEQKVKIIQFEYGLVNIESKFLLKDFYELLNANGYHIGKLYPDGVYFKEYEYTDENFIGPNYIAVLEQYKNHFKTF